MKKLILSLAVALTVFSIGCNNSGDPKDVVSNFYEAMAKKDVEGAKKYATKESAQMLDMFKAGLAQSTDNKGMEDFDKKNLEFGEPKIEGDKATVAVKNKLKGDSINMILKKEDGKWKVAFDKASLIEMGGGAGGNGAGGTGNGGMNGGTGTPGASQGNMGDTSANSNVPAMEDSAR